MGFQFGLECGEELQGFGCLGMRREVGEELLNVPDGQVFFAPLDIEVDEAEGCEVAGKTAGEGFFDTFEGLPVRCVAE